MLCGNLYTTSMLSAKVMPYPYTRTGSTFAEFIDCTVWVFEGKNFIILLLNSLIFKRRITWLFWSSLGPNLKKVIASQTNVNQIPFTCLLCNFKKAMGQAV